MTMKKFFTPIATVCLLLILQLTSQNDVYASHFMGIDIRVECINSCTTRVEWRGYRDCTGSSFLSSSGLFFNPTVTNCGSPTQIGNTSAPTQVEVTPVCSSVVTQCVQTGVTLNGVQEYFEYRDYDICTGINTNCAWNIQWASCCRNAIVTSGSANEGFGISNYYSIAQGCNNSPVYLNIPLFYACSGVTNGIFMGASDQDGDSLVYMLDACQNNTTTQSTYGAGYSPTSPLGPSWNVSVGPSSGILTIAPNPGNMVVGIVCITTLEYRNGMLIGTNTRDIQVAVLSCPNNTSPFLGAVSNLSSGASLTSPNTVTVCAGTPLCFDLEGYDVDTAFGQTVSLLWDQSIPTATFSQTGLPTVMDTVTGNSPNGTFCWSNPVAGVYPVVFGLRDNACPVYTYADQTIFIEVLGPPFGVTVNASSPNINTCTGNPVTLSVAGGPYNSYAWSNGATSSTINVTTPGTYTVTVTLGSCNVTGTGSYTVGTTTSPSVSGTVTLSNGTTPLVNAPVYLISHDSTLNALAAIDTATTDANGYYEFCGIAVDTFYLKAAPQLPAYPNHLPTYADTAVFFNNAAFFESNNAPMTVDWSVRSGSNPGGSGFIGGLITQGANKRQGVGDPMPDIQVFLYSTTFSQFIGTTITDANGYFSFPSIPLGNYEISVDVPNVDEINVPSVTLSGQIPSLDSLDLRLHSTYLELVVTTYTIIDPISESYFTVYPNPSTRDQSLLLYLVETAEVEMELYDIMGRKVRTVVSGQIDKGKHTLKLENLQSGAYFLKAQIGNKESIMKIVRW